MTIQQQQSTDTHEGPKLISFPSSTPRLQCYGRDVSLTVRDLPWQGSRCRLSDRQAGRSRTGEVVSFIGSFTSRFLAETHMLRGDRPISQQPTCSWGKRFPVRQHMSPEQKALAASADMVFYVFHSFSGRPRLFPLARNDRKKQSSLSRFEIMGLFPIASSGARAAVSTVELGLTVNCHSSGGKSANFFVSIVGGGCSSGYRSPAARLLTT